MRRRWRLVGVLVLWTLLLAPAATGGAAAEPAMGDGFHPTAGNATVAPTSAATATETLSLTKELQLTPARPGEITVTLRYDTPSSLASLRVTLPDDATVTGTRGFAADDDRYAWDERTSVPTLTYRLPVNETRDAAGPFAGRGDYLFVDAGSWALVRTPQVTTEWSVWRRPGVDEVPLSTSTTVAGSGVVGDEIVYLGEYQTHERTAHGQTLRLVEPASADLAEPPAAIFDAVVDASDAMRVGDRDSSVFMIAAPTDGVQWAVNGLQTGDADFWARDRSRLDTADNVWIHEYVHTRQDYDLAAETRWVTEASATYYAALFALERDQIDFRTFSSRLGLGSHSSYAEAILSDTSTWDQVAPYTKGALVAGEIDRRTRLAKPDDSLQTVFRKINAHDGTVRQSGLRRMVGSAGGSSVATLFDRYTATTDGPEMRDRTAHLRAFETRLPNVSYRLDAATNGTGLRVAGPYRSGAVGEGRPIRLATGETLTADVLVSNTGTAAGEYDARALVDDVTVARETGTLAPNATTRWPVSHTFTDAGEYTLTVGESQVDIVVSPPATPTVDRLSADVSDPVTGQNVTLTATVRNDDGVPAASNLTLSRNGRAVETRRVVLAPGEHRTPAFTLTHRTAGTYRYRLGSQNLTLTVREPSTPTVAGSANATATDSSGSGGGFGVGLAVLALALVGVAAARRR